MLRYAITSRRLFPGDDAQQQNALIRQCDRWGTEGIDFIQLREKDLPAAYLANLARQIVEALQATRSSTKLLINSRSDVAIATAADGVHLTAAPAELAAAQIRQLYAFAALRPPVISISCHSLSEVERGRQSDVDAILFGPVFEKSSGEKSSGGQRIADGVGLEQLHAACAAAGPIPLYALGGVDRKTAPACLAAGAAGVAGIRLFHDASPLSV
jgi:thiamine-phosphate pyrophosphorylase